jgi:hypothetical protein
VEGGNPKKGNRKKEDGSSNQKTKAQKAAEKLAKAKCFNCGEKGHLARNCPINLRKERMGESLNHLWQV